MILPVKRLTDTALLPTRPIPAMPGWIFDSGYRGPVKVLITNSGDYPYEIGRGDKIAQLLIQPVSLIDPVEVDSLNETERDAGGFGSSGK